MKNEIEQQPSSLQEEVLVELNADNAQEAIILSEIINRKY